MLPKYHHLGSGAGVVRPSRARGAGIGAVETRGVPLMKKLLLTSVALTALQIGVGEKTGTLLGQLVRCLRPRASEEATRLGLRSQDPPVPDTLA